MEIIRKKEDDIEFYTVALTGQSGMSQSGLAILAGVSQQALSQLEKTLTSRAPSKWLEPFVAKPLTLTIDDPKIDGKSVGNLKIYKAIYCAAVLAHYASPPDPNETALVSSLKFAGRGVNDWIQEITGWKQQVEVIQPYTNVYIQRIENMRDHQIANDVWMIFREAAELLLLIEKDWRVPINDFDILDGSIGKRWKDYRANKPWIKLDRTYIHCYRDQRGDIECAAYEHSELQYFNFWLKNEYVPKYLPLYLVNKYGKQAVKQIYAEVGQLTDYILEVTEIKRMTPQESERYKDFLIARQKLFGGFS
jgi:DNA-binding XRE family transcriptional regulator